MNKSKMLRIALSALILPDLVLGGTHNLPVTFITPAVAAASPGRNAERTRTQPLCSKKKGSATAATKKIQVKMLKHVAGTGQAGQVVMVTPAFYNNKLRPTKSAEMITDEQVQKEQATAAAAEKETKGKATQLKEKLSDFTLTVTRKAGPDGKLFGGIGPKVVADELKSHVGDDFLGNKGVKISGLLSSDRKKIRGDIKQTGEYGVSIELTKGISAEFSLVVQAET